MKAEWQKWSAQFAARPTREKRILAFAALAVAYALVDAVFLTSALTQWKTESRALAQKKSELEKISGQAKQLDEQIRTRDLQTKAALEAGRKELESVSKQLAEIEKTLVPARKMTELLNGLLPARGLEVVGLRNLPPTPLLTRNAANPAEAGSTAPQAPAANAEKAPGPPAEPAPPAANVYRHGVEIVLAGSYPALIEYLDRLENSPQKVIFGRMDLRTEQYPRSVLTLTVYTLSLDRSWLIV